MNEVDKWLQDGAGAEEGLRLLRNLCPNPIIDRMVSSNPGRYSFLLLKALKPFAGTIMKEVSPAAVKSFRQDWPFLSRADCPLQLKILAADKITAYHEYVSAHKQLSSCTTLTECYETAIKILKNYKQNRKIHSEFAYYQEHGKMLGKHPIFHEFDEMRKFQSLSIVDLVNKQKNLKEAIWRAKHEIDRGDKPHLDTIRTERIESKQRELQEVQRMIDDYADKNF